MLKLFYVIFMNLHRPPYMIPRMRAEADHPQRYTEEQRYSLVQHAIYLMNKTGKINTVETGAENLPKQGGYMMYPNHQGKYDVLGIMYTHKSPCSFVMDKRKSHTILVREFCDLVQAKRLEKDNPRQGITIINQVAKEVAAGRQAYVICPMVEEGESEDLENVVDYTEKLRAALPPSVQVAYLHGKVRPADKNRIMEEFAAKEIDVLVSTTVIEVGINVPNATVMMVENAERFGLAQLHQLRGRVGRGEFQSYCIFISTSEAKPAAAL